MPPVIATDKLVLLPLQIVAVPDNVAAVGRAFTVIEAVLLLLIAPLLQFAAFEIEVIVTVVAPPVAKLDVVNVPVPDENAIDAVLPVAVLLPVKL